jgi:hypothetical protein
MLGMPLLRARGTVALPAVSCITPRVLWLTIVNNHVYMEISFFWRPNLQINQFKSAYIMLAVNQILGIDLIRKFKEFDVVV